MAISIMCVSNKRRAWQRNKESVTRMASTRSDGVYGSVYAYGVNLYVISVTASGAEKRGSGASSGATS